VDNKEYLTNKSFCPIPWTGFMYNSNGDVMNCIRSQRAIGNLNNNSLADILQADIQTKENMLAHKPGQGCNGCYSLETNKKSFDIISDRVFYLKELKEVDKQLYDKIDNFELHQVDVRWSNVCNFACVYCSPEYSSKWATELKEEIVQPSSERVAELKSYVFDNVEKLKHVYLAGGEPLLMKENLELLALLKLTNPNVNLRVNTNLSKVDTKVFEAVCEFPNVHWIISIETVEEQFEYIRYGAKWNDFTDNLDIVRKLNHKVSFNMLYFLLNYSSLFNCIEYLQNCGFHNNSFIIGALSNPEYLNIRHLPEHVVNDLQTKLQTMINTKPGYLLEDSLKNLHSYMKTPFNKQLAGSIRDLKILDQRRGLNSELIFPEVYSFA
jgi:MoaA/NifB/PqqE/SkfB family radical SAM enzyme